MIFQWEGIHRSIGKLLILQRCGIKGIVFSIVLQEFLHIYQHSCIHQLLTVGIRINIYNIRHISASDQGL